MFSKVVLNILGTVFLFVGVLGVFLPLLPATPFLLLASACYVRGSETLHSRLMNHRYLGPYITNIKTERHAVKAKIITIVILWASLLFSIYRIDSCCWIDIGDCRHRRYDTDFKLQTLE